VAALVEVTDPQHSPWIAAMLSLSKAFVVSAMGWQAVSTAWWAMVPKSSRSELVMLPAGFATETSCWWIFAGKGVCHSMVGCWLLVGNQMTQCITAANVCRVARNDLPHLGGMLV